MSQQIIRLSVYFILLSGSTMSMTSLSCDCKLVK